MIPEGHRCVRVVSRIGDGGLSRSFQMNPDGSSVLMCMYCPDVCACACGVLIVHVMFLDVSGACVDSLTVKENGWQLQIMENNLGEQAWRTNLENKHGEPVSTRYCECRVLFMRNNRPRHGGCEGCYFHNTKFCVQGNHVLEALIG